MQKRAISIFPGREIASGEELIIDYGDAYWSGGFRELVL
jgi:SET domain-containing protein